MCIPLQVQSKPRYQAATNLPWGQGKQRPRCFRKPYTSLARFAACRFRPKSWLRRGDTMMPFQSSPCHCRRLGHIWRQFLEIFVIYFVFLPLLVLSAATGSKPWNVCTFHYLCSIIFLSYTCEIGLSVRRTGIIHLRVLVTSKFPLNKFTKV